jgi:hypothetical protein
MLEGLRMITRGVVGTTTMMTQMMMMMMMMVMTMMMTMILWVLQLRRQIATWKAAKEVRVIAYTTLMLITNGAGGCEHSASKRIYMMGIAAANNARSYAWEQKKHCKQHDAITRRKA